MFLFNHFLNIKRVVTHYVQTLYTCTYVSKEKQVCLPLLSKLAKRKPKI